MKDTSHLSTTLITPCLIGLWVWGEVWVRFLGRVCVSGGLMMDEDVEVWDEEGSVCVEETQREIRSCVRLPLCREAEWVMRLDDDSSHNFNEALMKHTNYNHKSQETSEMWENVWNSHCGLFLSWKCTQLLRAFSLCMFSLFLYFTLSFLSDQIFWLKLVYATYQALILSLHQILYNFSLSFSVCYLVCSNII